MLSKLDIDIRLENDKLKVNAPKGVLTPDLVGELKKKKEELIEFLKNEQKRQKYLSIKPVEKKEYYELSSAQKRLYILQQMDLESVVYNLPHTIYPDKGADTARLEVILNKLIARHESFRTSFQLVNEEPVQKVHDKVMFKIEYENPGDSAQKTEHPDAPGGMSLDMKELIENFIQPFDLSKAPLLRARLRRTREKSILVLDVHHVISDGMSLETFREEFQALYDGKKLPGLRLQYKDYAKWQNNPEQQGKIKSQEAYWLTRLSGELPVLNLQTDYTRPVVQSFTGKIAGFSLTGTESETIKNIVKETDTTLYMVILSIYNILLSKLSGQEDIIIGTPISGRKYPDLERIIGMFVNTLALRNFPSADKTVKTFLKEIKQGTLDAFENQEYQFEELVDKLSIKRDVSRNPVFDVMFNLLNHWEHTGESAGTGPGEDKKYAHIKGIAKFDMTLTAASPGETLHFAFDYCSKLFQPATIERFIRYFRKIITLLGANIHQKIADIEILSAEEKEQLLYDFNNKGTSYPGDKLIHELFKEQAGKTPDSTAVVGRAQGESGLRKQDLHITYKVLDQKTNQLGYRLKTMGIKPGTIAALVVERSIDMMVGILAVLKAGAAYLPMNPQNPLARTKYLLAESSAQLLLTHRGLINSSVGNIPVLDLEDEKKYNQDTTDLENTANHNNNAYLIYTSGSTGNPKGVIISHGNFSPLLHWGKAHLGFSPHDRVVQNLSYFFDWSVWEIFLTLCSGAQLHMVEERIILNAAEYSDFINRNKITVLHITPTHFQSLLAANLHFVSLKYLCIGAEKLTVDMVERSYRLINQDCRVFNMYGPTEATIIAAVLELDKTGRENYKKLSGIPIGRPVGNTTLLVLDKNLKLCPVHVQGELYIGGNALAQGYLNDAEKTRKSFITNAFKKIVGQYLYKTGDRVCWLADGNLDFFGRIDHQVKVRGYRIELGEIENQLLNHAEIKEVLVMAREDSKGEKYLCAYIVAERSAQGAADTANTLGPGALRDYLSKILPGYMIPSYFVPIEKIPLSPNGKVDRKALPEPEMAAGEDYLAPRDDTERKLTGLWADVLNIDKEVIGSNANFFELGGHSLKATVLVSRIHKEFNINIPLTEIFILQTVSALAGYIRNAEQEMFVAIAPLEKREYYQLSSAQKRLYILAQMNLAGTGYNMPAPIFLNKEPDKEKLDNTFRRLIQRHESFRTSFEMVNAAPVQKVHKNVKFEIEYDQVEENEQKTEDRRQMTDDGRQETDDKPGTYLSSVIRHLSSEFIRPFDLSQAPLLRARLLTTPLPRQNILLIDMHHIISDETSVEILSEEFQAIYDDQELPVLSLQYKDYAHWQNSRQQQQEIKKQQTYWLNQFPGEVPILKLPTDYPRPAVQSFEGNTVSFVLNAAETESINKITRETGTTLYMALFSIYNTLLAKLSGQEEIIIGTPTAGRNHSDLEPIIGMFVNTLALRNVPAGDKTVKEFLKEVKENTLNAFENQEYQFEDLVEKLSLERDASRNPLFDVMFNFITRAETNQSSAGFIGKEQYVYSKGMAKFDMTITAAVLGKQFYITFTYCTRLFQLPTIQRFIGYFRKIVSLLGLNINRKISTVEIISHQEKDQLLYDFNKTKSDYPEDKTIHCLFEEQVEKSQDHTAVLFHDRALTYQELNRSANRLAKILTRRGLQPGHVNIVGILFHRCPEVIVCMLAVLKAGVAYLPIDPDYPSARIKYMLADSQAVLLLTGGDLYTGLEYEGSLEVLKVEDEPIYSAVSQDSLYPSALAAAPQDIAYIIYTSGSTGRPRGVIIEHASVINLVFYQMQCYGMTKHDRVLQFSSISFDASVEQIFVAFYSGAGLVLVDRETLLDSNRFSAYSRQQAITHVNAVPSFLVTIGDEGWKGLKRVLSGGDICPKPLATKWSCIYDFYNKYGPTETTVVSIEFLATAVTGWEPMARVPIGRPLANTTVYILDRWQQPVPLAVSGELYIGGHGVARGYLNNPQQTHDNFQDNPFLKGERFYRTGDLCRWLINGNVEFLGRIDQQVKIRGFRIELGEIESQLLKYDAIKEAVVVTRGASKEDQYLCAYVVARPKPGDPAGHLADTLDSSALRDYLSKILPAYMIPSYFVPIEKIPLSPNGKVDRKALPEPELAVGEDYFAPRDDTERKLIGLWADVLNIDKEVIGSNANFFELGGHSLKATVLVSRIHKEFNVNFSLTEVFVLKTISALAGYIRNAEQEMFVAITPLEKREYYQLSSAQKRLYILAQMNLAGTGYNMPAPIFLNKEPDKEKLDNTFHRLIQRHESFRTSFEMVNAAPVQKVHKNVKFEIEYDQVEVKEKEGTRGLAPLSIPADGSPQPAADIFNNFIRPFDLSQAPLLRARLLTTPLPGQNILLVDMHHIISDGTSVEILREEFQTIYDGRELPVLSLQYKDYAHWQNSRQQQQEIKKQQTYWINQFPGEVPILKLPTDYPRPIVQSFEGNTVGFVLNAAETESINSITRETGTTLFMTLLSIYYILLAKLSGQEEIIIGTPTAGRNHSDLEPIIGMFVNTLALGNVPAGEKTVKEFLKEVKENTLNTFENQEYQFEDLVEKLSLARDASRNPLFDVMFSFLTRAETNPSSAGFIGKEQYVYSKGMAKFDMTLTAAVSGKQFYITFAYCTRLFQLPTIKRFIGYFRKIVSLLGLNINRKISTVEIISNEEKEQLLYDFNKTKRDYPKDKTIHCLFEEQVEKSQHHTAVLFHDRVLTYRELNERANQLAAGLRCRGVKPDTLVALMIEPCIHMVVGILGVLKAGGAYLPIEAEYPGERIAYMLRDSGVRILLCLKHQGERIRYNQGEGKREEIEFIFLDDDKIYTGPPENLASLSEPASILYTIYTSGSTGMPKGVMLKHENIVNYVTWFISELGIDSSDKSLLTSSLAFDLGYTALYPPLLKGGEFHIIPKESYLFANQLLDYIVGHGITYLKITPALFSTVVDSAKFTQQRCQSLHLVVLGGEAIIPGDVEKAFVCLKDIGLRIMNHYGPTESTIGSVAQLIDPGQLSDYIQRPTIGYPIHNTQVYILDRYLKLAAVGVGGELCIAGCGLARGYLNNPELTAERFCLRRPGGRFLKKLPPWTPRKNFLLKGSHKDHMQSCNHSAMQLSPNYSPQYPNTPLPHHPIYLTGDLARWLWDGRIEFLGRHDQQIKIRGFRIEMGEIENHLLRHPLVKEAVLMVRQDQDVYLTAYVVAGADVTELELREYLGQGLPDYMIPSYFVRLERIPVTPNGKVDWRALPEPEAVGISYISPRTHSEETLVEIWSEVLGVARGRLGIDDHFFQLGGHSLKATVVIARIHRAFDVRIPLVELFKSPTIRGLSSYIEGASLDKYKAIEPIEKKEYYALSSAQQRLYILHQMEVEDTSYNMLRVMPLEMGMGIDMDVGMDMDMDKLVDMNIQGLERAFSALIMRHESLRTSFHMINGEPLQKIHESVDFEIENYDMKGFDPIKNFVRPFDLSCAPLLRVGLVKSVEGRLILLMDTHHIISDGISHRLLLKDLMSLYPGEELPGLRLQYKDYAAWQNSEKERERLKKQEKWWLELFSARAAVLDLPTDFPRPQVQSFEGGYIHFSLDKEKTSGLRDLAVHQDATLYMGLLSLFFILLSKLSSQEDIVIGSPIAGRRHTDLEPICGMFVNTLAMRSYPAGHKSFAGFLPEVKRMTLEAFENQDYQFEDLVEKVVVDRDASRNPLFDVMFVWQNLEGPLDTVFEPDVPGTANVPVPPPPGTKQQELNEYEYEHRTSKFDLTLGAREIGDQIIMGFEYCTRLFKPGTIQRFITYFKKVLDSMVETPHQPIMYIELISASEKQQILFDFNNTDTEYPTDKTIGQLFAQQSLQSPNHSAVIFHDHLLTYERLDRSSGQLAYLLHEKGIGPDIIVGIMMPRSIEMIIAVLGILKAGGAYLPIDFEYPGDRIDYMLTDSGANVLVTTTKIFKEEGKIGNWKGEKIFLNEGNSLAGPANQPATLNWQPAASPFNLCYVIYTSGTTGNPKGVVIQHGSLVNIIISLFHHYPFSREDTYLFKTPYVFDVSVSELFGWFLGGGRLAILEEEAEKDPEKISNAIEQLTVSHINFVPSMFNVFVHGMTPQTIRKLSRLKYIFLAGEVLLPLVVNQFRELNSSILLENLYGPTEGTIYASSYSLVDGKGVSPIPIGKPLENMKLYVMNTYSNLQPVGVPGELCIGGAGVARGYLNWPELTAERFCLRRPGGRFSAKGARCRLQVKVKKWKTSSETIPPLIGPPCHGAPWTPRKNFLLEGTRELDSLLYRTGDLCRWLTDGNIEFLGRMDHQVKIRGFRIELGEIESQLLKYDAIKEAVVVTRAASKEDQYLCAYVVARPKPGDPAGHLADTLDSSALRDYLSEILPGYMIPSYFVTLEKIPLTPNGKVDRKALPEPEINAGEKYAAPGDEIETKLVEIWSDILTVKKEKIGIDANFFHLGGHSLKAVMMAARSHKELKVNIPLSEVFKNSTIRGLAEYIRYKKGVVKGEYTTSNWSSLVKLKTSGNLEPFFCIHAAAGLINPYRELARLMEQNRPLYGLQHPGLDGNCEPYTDIESMAAYYADIIRDIQPVGPYFIGGWSFGGSVALEIAQKLIHKGQQVQLLVLIDSAVPPVLAYEDNAAMLSHLASILSKGLMVDFHVSTRELKEISPGNRINYFLDQVKKALQDKKAKERKISQLKNIVQVYQVCSNALRMYKPQKYPGRILLFRAGDVNGAAPDSLFDWSPMSPIPVITRKIPGSHFTIMEKPNIQVLARELNQYLRLK